MIAKLGRSTDGLDTVLLKDKKEKRGKSKEKEEKEEEEQEDKHHSSGEEDRDYTPDDA